MQVTINLFANTGFQHGTPVSCSGYEIAEHDQYTTIQLLRDIDGIDYVIRELKISHQHSYELIVEE
jgi:hypothetical protein